MTQETTTRSDPAGAEGRGAEDGRAEGRGAEGHRWAVILAGGDGKRLLPLTRRLSGDDRPKQFCKVLGAETLLDQTLHRIARIVSPARTLIAVTKAHQHFYRDIGTAGLLVQPRNKGTNPAIAYSLVRLHEMDPRAVVAFFPSDHHFTNDEVFADCVRQAFDSAERYSNTVILLGIAPNHPETSYGWIEPGEQLMADGPGEVFVVRRFWEKPSSAVAIDLLRRGCFWNSFIMVGRVGSFLSLVEHAAPTLFRSFHAIAPTFFTHREEAGVLNLYLGIPPSSFSTDVLSVCANRLAVFCNRALEWADVGDVGRALSLRERAGPPPRKGAAVQPEEIQVAAAAG